MIPGDRAELLDYKAIPSHCGEVGEVRNFREVGFQMHNIEYEYLIKFPNGNLFWIPTRYLREVKDD